MRSVAFGLLLMSPALATAKPEPWVVHHSDAGRFEVKMPPRPKSDNRRLATPAGSLNVITVQAEADRYLHVAVVVTDYPEAFGELSSGRVLDGVRDGLKGLDGRVTKDATVGVGPDGTPGRDITVTAGDNVVRCRAVLVGRRLYQVTAAGRKDAVGSAPAEDFFRSFEVVK